MKRLYTPEASQHWQRRASLARIIGPGLVVLALIVCIVLCTMVNTANAQQMLFACMSIFTLAGWICIFLLYAVWAPARAQATHIAGMLEQEPELYEGELTIHSDSFRIPKSVTVRKAALNTTDGVLSLSVSAALAEQFPANGTKVRVWTVRKFIVAYEVCA